MTYNPNPEIAYKQFTNFRHVTHPDSVIEIFKSGSIKKADLDEMRYKEKAKGLQGIWLSPNQFYSGYHHGNVEFVFDFESVIEGKRFYEFGNRNRDGGFDSFQILISDRDHPNLKKYVPEEYGGVWHVGLNRQHMMAPFGWLEFIFEGDLPIANAKYLSDVQHHPDKCFSNGNECKYLKIAPDMVKPELIGLCLKEEVPFPHNLLWNPENWIKNAWVTISNGFRRSNFDGHCKANHQSLAIAILRQIGKTGGSKSAARYLNAFVVKTMQH